MSQTVVDFSTDPTGVELLDDLLTPLQENFLTNHSGTSRPSYAVAHTIWTNTTTTPWVVNYFDGTNDIPVGTVNATTNVFTPSGLTLNNITATTNPTVNDDAADGYSVGSIWVNTSADTIYILADTTVGAAVWKNTTPTSITNSDLATMAANTAKVNNTASSANPADLAIGLNQFLGRGASGNLAALSIASMLQFIGTTLNVKSASSSQLGVVQPDGTTCDIVGGLLQVLAGLPTQIAGNLNTSGTDTVLTVDFTTYSSYSIHLLGMSTNGTGGTATSMKVKYSTDGGANYFDFSTAAMQQIFSTDTTGVGAAMFVTISQAATNSHAYALCFGEDIKNLTHLTGPVLGYANISAAINRIKLEAQSGPVNGGKFIAAPIAKR